MSKLQALKARQRRLAFGVRRLAFGVWRSEFGVRLAQGTRRPDTAKENSRVLNCASRRFQQPCPRNLERQTPPSRFQRCNPS
jgi:hypothetical protein